MTNKRKPGRPKSDKPPAKTVSITMPHKTFIKIENDRGQTPRSQFILKKSGYEK